MRFCWISLGFVVHSPAILLSFFSSVFFCFSASEHFEVILMAITGKENENQKEIRGRAFVLQDSSKNKQPAHRIFLWLSAGLCKRQKRRTFFRRRGRSLLEKVAPTQGFRQLGRATHFHWCTKRKAQHVSVTELLKDKGPNERLPHRPALVVAQFLDLACGKTSFWGYPQAVRRITLISAGAGDEVRVAYWRICSGRIKGVCFLLVIFFKGNLPSISAANYIEEFIFLKCL